MSKRRRNKRWPLSAAERRLGVAARRVRRLLVVAAVVTALVALDRVGWGVVGAGEMARYNGRAFLVVRVIDGDTLDISASDGDRPVTRVRLWGIDAPELAKPWEPPETAEHGAEEAKQALAAWTQQRLVVLELLPHRVRDNFGRTLAYVHDVNGVCVNERLVREGHARADGRWWHPRAGAYQLLDETARRTRRGLWSAE